MPPLGNAPAEYVAAGFYQTLALKTDRRLVPTRDARRNGIEDNALIGTSVTPNISRPTIWPRNCGRSAPPMTGIKAKQICREAGSS